MSLDPKDDPAKAVAELAGSRTPWLFGVRHHSPACSIALPHLLDAYKPTVIALELPADLGHWIEWLGHPEAAAPLAVAGVSRHGADLGFYPFADFSPELVAIRWARANNVPVVAIDLPMGRRGGHDRDSAGIGIGERMRGSEEDSWEHLVEAPGTSSDPERVRRAALLYGWALRLDSVRGGGVSELDLVREAFMREELRKLGAYDGVEEDVDEDVEDDDIVGADAGGADEVESRPAAKAKPAAKEKPDGNKCSQFFLI